MMLLASTGNDIPGFLLMGGMVMGAFIMSVYAIYRGFRKLSFKHQIENIPTAKARSCAMGLVELKGKVRGRSFIRSPYSNMSCVYYFYCYMEPGAPRKHAYREREESRMFFLDDGTGMVLISPGFSAEHLKPDEKSFVKEMKETYIQAGDELYVLGKAKAWKPTYVPFIRKMLDSGGKIDIPIMLAQYKNFLEDNPKPDRPPLRQLLRLAEELAQTCLDSKSEGHPKILDFEEKCDRMICRDDEHDLYIVSDRKEFSICRKLGVKALSNFAVGGVCTALTMGLASLDIKLFVGFSLCGIISLSGMGWYFLSYQRNTR